jgi:hypothetical protein
MATPAAYITAICFRGGPLGRFLALAAYWVPLALWMRLAGLAVFTRLLYLQYMSMSWFASYVFNVLLLELIAEPSPNPSCYYEYANPCFAAQQVYHYVVMINLHRLYYREPYTLMACLTDLTAALAVPGVLWWSGSFSFLQILYGALAGIGVGLATSMSLYLFWLDRFPFIMQNTIMTRWLSMRSHTGLSEKELAHIDKLDPEFREEVTDGQQQQGFWRRVKFGARMIVHVEQNVVEANHDPHGAVVEAVFPISL